MSLVIEQGDYVYFTDTSSGGPTAWDWSFLGGNPTSSNSQNPIVQYLSSSSPGGFPVTLNISKGLLTASKTENGAIIVLPENLYLEVDAFPSSTSVDMSTNLDYQITLAPSSAISYYRWVLPGATGFSSGLGFTGPSTNLSQTIRTDDWYLATLTYGGATYSTYSINAVVYAYSVLGNVDANSVQITFNKNGPDESVNFGDPNSYEPLTQFYSATILPYVTPTAGLPGGGPVLSIAAPGGELDNPYFRGHGEFIYYSTSNMDVGNLPPVSDGILPLMLVASGTGLNDIGVPYTGWESLPRYTSGDYMTPGDVSFYFDGTLYLGDALGNLRKLLLPPRSWTDTQISSIVFETAVASQTSKNLELFNGYLPLATIFGEDGYGGASGGFGGCCLPCRNLCGDDVIIYLDLYYSQEGSIQSIDPGLTFQIPITISSNTINGGNGNSFDGRLVLAQNTTAGQGIASIIQSELDNYFVANLGNPSNDFVKAEASPDYAFQYNSAQYDVNVFNGLKITITKNDPINTGAGPYLVKIGLSDNLLNNPLMGLPYNKTTSFGTSGTFAGNWTCLGMNYISNPAQEYAQFLPIPYRGFSYGSIPY